jgi:hypothetical protein
VLAEDAGDDDGVQREQRQLVARTPDARLDDDHLASRSGEEAKAADHEQATGREVPVVTVDRGKRADRRLDRREHAEVVGLAEIAAVEADAVEVCDHARAQDRADGEPGRRERGRRVHGRRSLAFRADDTDERDVPQPLLNAEHLDECRRTSEASRAPAAQLPPLREDGTVLEVGDVVARGHRRRIRS